MYEMALCMYGPGADPGVQAVFVLETGDHHWFLHPYDCGYLYLCIVNVGCLIHEPFEYQY